MTSFRRKPVSRYLTQFSPHALRSLSKPNTRRRRRRDSTRQLRRVGVGGEYWALQYGRIDHTYSPQPVVLEVFEGWGSQGILNDVSQKNSLG